MSSHLGLRTSRSRDPLPGYLYSYPDWRSITADASGKRQSPIDIVSREAMYDEPLSKSALTFNYGTSRETDILNSGNTLVVIPHAKQEVGGGPLTGESDFELAEIRFHWGRDNSRGSEHTVNGKAFPMEVQLVHWNSRLYESVEEAVGSSQGIAILAIFAQIGREHQGLRVITDNLEDVQYKGRQKTLTAPFTSSLLLPDPQLRDFWTYEGSLTTPPCTENVTWIVLRYPLMLSHAQLEDFRRLRTYGRGEQPRPGDNGVMADNFRPTQLLNGRKVLASFQ